MVLSKYQQVSGTSVPWQGLGKSRQATRLSGAAFLRKARRQGEGVLEVRRAKVDNALREKASRAGVEVAAIFPGQSP